MSKKRATIRQKKAFKIMVEETKKPVPRALHAVLKEAGYGSIANMPCRILDSQGFQLLVNKYLNDDEMLDKVREIYLGDDKRSALAAIDMGWKLKGRYPKEQIDVTVSQKRESLFLSNDASNIRPEITGDNQVETQPPTRDDIERC